MARGRQQQWEHGQVAVRLGGSQQVKVVAVVVALPRRIPSPKGIRLGIVTVAFALLDTTSVAVADAVLAFARGRPDRRAVTSQAEVLGVDETLVNRMLQEQLEKLDMFRMN